MDVDLNCDLGEGCPHDAELMAMITSANVACGGHAGDLATALVTLELAGEYGVQVGAHPGFLDYVEEEGIDLLADRFAPPEWYT